MTKEIVDYLNLFFMKNDKLYDEIVYPIENNLLYLDDISENNCLSLNIIKENIDDFNNNPFVKNIKLENIKDRNIEIRNEKIFKYQLFINNTYTNQNLDEIINLGYFSDDISFPVIYENGIPWMSIVPSEINTMKNDIDKMNGNVLILGCGLGYIAYMLSLKENIKKITIVDMNYKIVNIFKKYILPQFNTDKIEIKICDGIEFLRTNKENYDYIYCDIWRNGIDGLPLYLKLKELENTYNHSTFLYWIEDEIIEQIRLQIYRDIINDNLTENEEIFLSKISTIDDLFKHLTKNNIIKNYLPLCNFIL